MGPIEIDLRDFVAKWSLNMQQTDLLASKILEDVSTAFAKKWSETAGNELKQTRSEYQKAIFIEKIDNYNVVVGLKGSLPNMLEKGADPFDQKDHFERSSKKKIGKNGKWYLTIPFRFATPTAVATSAIFSNIMPTAVYDIAKQLANKTSLQAHSLPIQFQIPTQRTSIPNFGDYTRKHSIYEGITRNEDNLGRSQYISFRRVSELSDPNSWIHTGLIARNFAEKALSSFNIVSVIERSKVEFYQKYLSL